MSDHDFDDLLQPTVQERTGPRRLPWRLDRQFWVAFFGGSFAVTLIAFLNALRLGVEPAKRAMILLAGAVAVGGTATAMHLVETGSRERVAWRVIAVALYLVVRQLQKAADDHHQVFRRGEYAPMTVPAVAACVAGLAMNIGLVVLVRMLG